MVQTAEVFQRRSNQLSRCGAECVVKDWDALRNTPKPFRSPQRTQTRRISIEWLLPEANTDGAVTVGENDQQLVSARARPSIDVATVTERNPQSAT